MLVLYDTTGITVKHRIQDYDHVRIGVLQTSIWKSGRRRNIRDNQKPHVEHDGNDFADLLAEMDRLP